jgi:hypothetical protein
MNLLRHGIILATLAIVACGSGDDDDRPKFMGARTGGKTGSGGSKASGGSKNSGGTAGDGGTPETGGADGGPGGSGGAGTGGAGGTVSTGGAGGAVVLPTCTLSTGNEICDDCIHRLCSFDCAACEGNQGCASIVDCVLDACTAGFNNDCMNPCFVKYPGGYNAFNKIVFDCGRDRCGAGICPFAP